MCYTHHTAVSHADRMLLKVGKGGGYKSERGMLKDELTFDKLPFSSTKRGALLLTGSGSDSL